MGILLHAEARPELWENVTRLLAEKEIHIVAADTLSDRSAAQLHRRLTVAINNIQQLGSLLKRLGQTPGVLDVRRSEPEKQGKDGRGPCLLGNKMKKYFQNVVKNIHSNPPPQPRKKSFNPQPETKNIKCF